MSITEYLTEEARKFGRKNMIVHPGDIVMSDMGSKGILRRVKIVGVKVSLISRFNGVFNVEAKAFDPPGATWVLEFCMQYVGQRLKKDGAVLGQKGSAFYMGNFTKDDGTVWKNDIHQSSKVTYFNHVALNFSIENTYDHAKGEYVC